MSRASNLKVHCGNWGDNRDEIYLELGCKSPNGGMLQVMPNMGWARGPPKGNWGEKLGSKHGGGQLDGNLCELELQK